MKRVLTFLLAMVCMSSLYLPASAQDAPESILFTFAGDCTFGSPPTSYNSPSGFVQTVGEDYGYPFRNVLSYLEEDDLTVINLEGPLTEHTGFVSKQFIFRGPERFTNILTGSSVEAVSIANNHTHDYTQQGYDDTRRALEEAGVPYVEADRGTLVRLENGLTVGLYGMVYYRYPDARELRDAFQKLREDGADVIVFLPHWGVEESYSLSPAQIQTAHDAIDAGATIVCGSHPHVLQEVEHYGNGIIFYSMGNFSFGGNGKPSDFDTALLRQELLIGKDGTVTLGKTTAIPACISSSPWVNNYQPTPYEEGSPGYARVMQKLKLEQK